MLNFIFATIFFMGQNESANSGSSSNISRDLSSDLKDIYPGPSNKSGLIADEVFCFDCNQRNCLSSIEKLENLLNHRILKEIDIDGSVMLNLDRILSKIEYLRKKIGLIDKGEKIDESDMEEALCRLYDQNEFITELFPSLINYVNREKQAITDKKPPYDKLEPEYSHIGIAVDSVYGKKIAEIEIMSQHLANVEIPDLIAELKGLKLEQSMIINEIEKL